MRLAVLALILVAACRPPGYGKDEKPDASEAMPDAGPTGDAALLDTPAAATCDRAFRLDGYTTSTSVWLTGSFIAWAGNPGAGAVAFTQGSDGAWTGSYAFEAGGHHYKFIVDGSTWITDPTNPNTANDGNGNTNSVYTCVP